MPGFFACWTRKEAFLKATGHPDLDPELEEINGNAEPGKLWFLADINVLDGYRATAALDCSFSPGNLRGSWQTEKNKNAPRPSRSRGAKE